MLYLDYVGPHGISDTYGGWFHVYSFAIMSGIFVAVFASWIKLRRYGIPTDTLTWSIVFIIPAALLGASFLGKDNPEHPMPFFAKFAFWKGGLSIHGGVLFGIIAGVIIFYFVSRKYKISLWIYGDCIIPNILLGQVLGRWGNFFNHELLGSIVDYETLAWLPAFIRDNCFRLEGGIPEGGFTNTVFRAPIFLYESIGNLGLWAIITFIVPNLGKWWGKKPWKVEPDKYQFNFKDNFKYCIITVFNPKYWKKENRNPNRLTWSEIWNQAYYQNKVPIALVKKRLATIPNFNSSSSMSNFKNYRTRSKVLYEINNPHQYRIMYAGVQIGLYLFGWNLIRFILELQRDKKDLFLINRPTLDYTVILLCATLGLLIAIFTQFIAPKNFRREAWTYEKEY